MQVRRSSKHHVTETLATGTRVPRSLASIYGSMWVQNIEEQRNIHGEVISARIFMFLYGIEREYSGAFFYFKYSPLQSMELQGILTTGIPAPIHQHNN